MENIKKVVLAYSGGLDTSVIIPWLKENYNGCEVIAVCADIGQGDELNVVHDKALKSGASKVYIEHLTEDFVENYVFPTLKASAANGSVTDGFLHNSSSVFGCVPFTASTSNGDGKNAQTASNTA